MYRPSKPATQRTTPATTTSTKAVPRSFPARTRPDSATRTTTTGPKVRHAITERDRIPFRDIADFSNRLPRAGTGINTGSGKLDTRSRYFKVLIRSRYGNADTVSVALLDRQTPWPAIVWQKLE